MKKVILLATTWTPTYWNVSQEAPYPKKRYKELSDWEELSKNCPLPGLGIYIKQKDRNMKFSYLLIKGMRYDSVSEQPYFEFAPIHESSTESRELTSKLPNENRTLFSSIQSDTLINILKNIGESPPEEWKNLIELKETIISWQDYIGKYFLEIESKNLSNEEFEDRIFNLLKALGFDVIQKGYTIPGAYADGVFSLDIYATVYDCKNTSNFFPNEADKRAIDKYLQDEKRIRKEKKIYSAFIAKSFGEISRGDVFYFNVNSFIYLLYKKIQIGSRFTLDPIKKILEDKIILTNDIIDKEWRI
jgi:hypothetical protein